MLSLLKVSQQSKLAAMKGLRNVTVAQKKPEAQLANSSLAILSGFSFLLIAFLITSCTLAVYAVNLVLVPSLIIRKLYSSEGC